MQEGAVLRRAVAILAGVALTLQLTGPADCVLDQAQVVAVPPSTFQVLTTWRCGALICWERWTEHEGRKIGFGRACETSSNNDGNAVEAIKP